MSKDTYEFETGADAVKLLGGFFVHCCFLRGRCNPE